jgi:hypothetical protein
MSAQPALIRHAGIVRISNSIGQGGPKIASMFESNAARIPTPEYSWLTLREAPGVSDLETMTLIVPHARAAS